MSVIILRVEILEIEEAKVCESSPAVTRLAVYCWPQVLRRASYHMVILEEEYQQVPRLAAPPGTNTCKVSLRFIHLATLLPNIAKFGTLVGQHVLWLEKVCETREQLVSPVKRKSN